MMTFEQVRNLPKEMLISLLKTAQLTWSDDWFPCDELRCSRLGTSDPPTPREIELRARMDRNVEWQKILLMAIGDARPALVRVLFDNLDLFEEPWRLAAYPVPPIQHMLLIDLGE